MHLQSKLVRNMVRLKVNPSIIYVPLLNGIHIAPQPDADFMLFDRVVCVRRGYPMALGARGTVIAMRPKCGTHPTMNTDNLYSIEILMDESFNMYGKSQRIFNAFTTAMFINLSFGSRKNG